jgi:hypothetical protein
LTRVRGNALRENRETVIDDEELGKALERASLIKDLKTGFTQKR